MRHVSAITGGLELRYAGQLLADAMRDAETEIDISAADMVVGYAARFNQPSQEMTIGKMERVVEIIRPGAFDGVLGQDVVALFNHDANQPLARTTAGTLRLSVDDIGLRYEFDLADDDVSELVAKFINDGRVAGSSFGFIVDPAGENWARGSDGVVQRTISRFSRLLDVSPCTFPAYLSTTAQLRAENGGFGDGLAELLAREQRDVARAVANARARELELIEFSLGR